jgi:hypothetical protein
MHDTCRQASARHRSRARRRVRARDRVPRVQVRLPARERVIARARVDAVNRDTATSPGAAMQRGTSVAGWATRASSRPARSPARTPGNRERRGAGLASSVGNLDRNPRHATARPHPAPLRPVRPPAAATRLLRRHLLDSLTAGQLVRRGSCRARAACSRSVLALAVRRSTSGSGRPALSVERSAFSVALVDASFRLDNVLIDRDRCSCTGGRLGGWAQRITEDGRRPQSTAEERRGTQRNAEERRRAQTSADERRRAPTSADARRRAQRSAEERRRAQKSAEERRRAQTNVKQRRRAQRNADELQDNSRKSSPSSRRACIRNPRWITPSPPRPLRPLR